MKNHQLTLSKGVLETGLIVKMSKRSNVNVSIPCSRLQRRVEDLLLLAKVSGGQVNCVVERYFPRVLPKHPWVKISKHPENTSDYTLLVRCDKEVFECRLQMQRHLESPGLLARLSVLTEEICKDGWFGKKETEVVPVNIQRPEPQAPVFVPQKPVEPLIEINRQAEPAQATFVEQASNWLAEADALILANTTKIAELEAALEQEISILRAKYAATQRLLQNEIDSIKETRRRLSVASSA